MHVTKTVQFDWSAVFESFWYKKLARNKAAFYSVQLASFWYKFYVQVSWACVTSINVVFLSSKISECLYNRAVSVGKIA